MPALSEMLQAGEGPAIDVKHHLLPGSLDSCQTPSLKTIFVQYKFSMAVQNIMTILDSSLVSVAMQLVTLLRPELTCQILSLDCNASKKQLLTHKQVLLRIRPLA
jgi:hypothetical protein